jgi:hypothetical protein
MAEVKKVISNDTLPIPIDERSGVYLMKMNGECAKYEYKDVRGKVDRDGQYKVILSGKEYLLRNGLWFPKTEWKQIIYHDILDNEIFSMWEKACNEQLNRRDLTKFIKHRWVFLEEKDDKTIEIKVDGICIMDILESNMENLYSDEFWKRWYNRYILKDRTRVKIKLAVYDTEFEITIDKKDIEKYFYAARIVSDRFNAYTLAYKKNKTEHEIALMTMLDLVFYKT